MNIDAYRIHKPLKTLLTRKYLTGTVHSVFQHVINISVFQEDNSFIIISLLTNNPEVFPWSIILPVKTFNPLDFTIGQKIDLTENYIKSDSMIINLTKAITYETALPDYVENADLAKNMAFIHDILSHNKNEEPAENIFAKKSQEFLKEGLSQAKASLQCGDTDNLLLNLIHIIGLGQGLTPSGDDYLTSLMALIKMPQSPLGNLDWICSSVTAEAAYKTNMLSYFYLKRAAMGHVRGKLASFIESVTTGNELEKSTLDLLSVGSSSGRDLANGVLFGFQLIDIVKSRKSFDK